MLSNVAVMRTRALATVDLALAGLAAGLYLLLGLATAARSKRAVGQLPRTLMYVTAAYTLREHRQRRSEAFVTHRDLGGYLHHVWSVHPALGANPDHLAEDRVGAFRATALATRHTFVEAPIGRFPKLVGCPRLNFVLAQICLLRMLGRLCRSNRIGIVAAGDPYYGGLLAAFLAHRYGLPLRIVVGGNYDLAYTNTGVAAYPRLLRSRRLERLVARFILSRADQVITGSDDNEAFVIRNGARRSRVGRLGNWNMINPVHLAEPTGRRPVGGIGGFDGSPFVICVSRLERVKHPEDVVTALAVAREQHPGLTGVLAGDGSMREELRRLGVRLNLGDAFHLVGDRDQEWLAGMLRKASVVAAPMAGLALVEAALSGTPIVAYDVEWHAEVLTHGETALIVPYRDTAALGGAIAQLVGDPSLAFELGRRGREAMLRLMNPSVVLKAERDQVDRLLGVRSSVK